MSWRILYTRAAQKGLMRLSRQDQGRVRDFLENELLKFPSPRHRGMAMTAEFHTNWRYRLGDIRVICEIRDQELVVLVIKVGNRKDVYR